MVSQGIVADVAIDDSAPPFVPQRPMTEEEFVAWCQEDVRAEWVEGEVILMAAASARHEQLLVWLGGLLGQLAAERDCGRVYGPEFTMRLTRRVRSRRFPDLKFVATEHLSRVHQNHLEGPADLVFEIVSPESVSRDWREKYSAYAHAGVPEYWIVDPTSEQFAANRLNAEGKYEQISAIDGRVHSTVLPGFWLRPEWLWQDPLPRPLQIAREWGLIP